MGFRCHAFREGWAPERMGLDWVPLAAERVCEVAYDHLDGGRPRQPTRFRRGRPDRDPRSCDFDRLASTPADLEGDSEHAVSAALELPEAGSVELVSGADEVRQSQREPRSPDGVLHRQLAAEVGGERG
jgi:hypothetical protein